MRKEIDELSTKWEWQSVGCNWITWAVGHSGDTGLKCGGKDMKVVDLSMLEMGQ